MHTLRAYLKLIQLRHVEITSGLKTSKALGLSPSVVCQWGRGNLPTDAHMLKIAELAGIEQSEALIDLHTWRAKSPEVKKVYAEMAARLSSKAKAAALTCLLFAMAAFGAPALAGTERAQIDLGSSQLIHYAGIMREWARRRLREISIKCLGIARLVKGFTIDSANPRRANLLTVAV